MTTQQSLKQQYSLLFRAQTILSGQIQAAKKAGDIEQVKVLKAKVKANNKTMNQINKELVG